MIRDLIIETATDLFIQYGIKQVSMDNIAGQMHISKKTIYEHFQGKEELLKTGLQELTEKNCRQIEEIICTEPSVLSAIMQMNSILLKQVLSFCPAFIRDLKEYSNEFTKIAKSYQTFIEKKYLALFNRGVKEGIFIGEYNRVPITKLFFAQIEWVCANPQENIKQRIEIYTPTILALLANLCTEQGRKELNSISTKQYYI